MNLLKQKIRNKIKKKIKIRREGGEGWRYPSFKYNFTFPDKKIRVIISNRCTIPRSKVRRSIAFFGSVSARSRRTFRKREAATEFSSARDIIFSHGCRCIIHNAFDTVSTIRGSIERMSCDLFRYFSIPLYVHTMLIIKKNIRRISHFIIIYHFSW